MAHSLPRTFSASIPHPAAANICTGTRLSPAHISTGTGLITDIGLAKPAHICTHICAWAESAHAPHSPTSLRRQESPCNSCAGAGLTPSHSCTGAGLIPPTSSLGLNRLTPAHICAGTGLNSSLICAGTESVSHFASAQPFPRLHWDWAHPPTHIGTGRR